MRLLISLAMAIILCGSHAWAGCRSDCRSDYEAEVNSCKTLEDDPDDAEELRVCLENAKSDYEVCVNECED